MSKKEQIIVSVRLSVFENMMLEKLAMDSGRCKSDFLRLILQKQLNLKKEESNMVEKLNINIGDTKEIYELINELAETNNKNFTYILNTFLNLNRDRAKMILKIWNIELKNEE